MAIDDGDGMSILGRLIPPAAVAELELAFGLDGTIELSAADLCSAAQKGSGIPIPGLGGATLVVALVNGTRRLEIRNYRPDDRERLKARGAFSEVIAYKTRLFIPADRSHAVVEAILAMTQGVALTLAALRKEPSGEKLLERFPFFPRETTGEAPQMRRPSSPPPAA